MAHTVKNVTILATEYNTKETLDNEKISAASAGKIIVHVRCKDHGLRL